MCINWALDRTRLERSHSHIEAGSGSYIVNWRILGQTACAFWAGIALFACAAARAPLAETAPAVIAIGDLHGDYGAYESLMHEAGLMDKRGRWTGGETIFVQTGDVPDRGPDSLKIIRSLQKLQKQASRKGGEVITLIGNHEAMNMTGDLRYVHAGEYDAFTDRNSQRLRDRVYNANRDAIETAYLEQDPALSSEDIRARWGAQTPLGMIEHQQAWRPEGDIGKWVAGNPAIAIVGETLFVHGGISEHYARFSVDELNAMTAGALSARAIDPASIINDENGPLWYRGLIIRNGAPALETSAAAETALAPARLSIEDEINLVLNTYNVTRIVVGHTPSLTGIAAAHDGKLIQIDTGIAAYYGGTQSFLRIAGGVAYAHDNGIVSVIGTAP